MWKQGFCSTCPFRFAKDSGTMAKVHARWCPMFIVSTCDYSFFSGRAGFRVCLDGLGCLDFSDFSFWKIHLVAYFLLFVAGHDLVASSLFVSNIFLIIIGLVHNTIV